MRDTDSNAEPSDELQSGSRSQRGRRRRTVLGLIGTGLLVGLAGCSNSSNESQAQQTQQSTDTQRVTSTESTTEGSLQVRTVAEGAFQYAGGINGTLTYIIGSGIKHVVYGDRKGPGFEFPGPPVGIGDEIAYSAVDTPDRTEYAYLRRGGQQVTRFTLDEDVTDRQEKTGDLKFWGVHDDKMLWTTWRGVGPSSFMYGQQQVDTQYDIVKSVTGIGDEIGYIAYRELPDKPYDRSTAVVVGGEPVWEEKEGIGIKRTAHLKDISGTAAYVVNDGFNGPYVQLGEQAIGKSYTKSPSGEVRWFGEIAGKLAAIFRVAEDQIQNPDRRTEDVLWYDGQEVARHESISNSAVPFSLDGDIAYLFDDVDKSGLNVGGELVVEDPGRWATIDGELAYSTWVGEDSQAVFYQGRQSKTYDGIEHIFEVDGRLGYVAREGPSSKSAKLLLQE